MLKCDRFLEANLLVTDKTHSGQVKNLHTYFLKSIINEDCKISLAVYEVERLLYRIKPSSQASITYPGGFISTAVMRLPMWLHIF